MFEDMFNDLFIESAFGNDDDSFVEGVTLSTDEDGFVSADVEIDEANVIDGDPFEFLTEAMYQNVINANNISMAILAENYMYLKENGVELVTEAEEKEKQKGRFKEAVVKFFKNLKEKIIKFFNSVLAKMVELQAKFRVLSKKGQARAAAGMKTLPKDIVVHSYIPIEVTKWAEKCMKSLENMELPSEPEFSLKNKTTNKVYFETELKTLKDYGKQVSEVKKLKNTSLKAIGTMEKEFMKSDDVKGENLGTKRDIHKSYAELGNQVVAVAKEATSLIMVRVNDAAKVINAACKANKENEKNKKEAQNASAIFSLDNLEMV